jgi:hypothetical protein
MAAQTRMRIKPIMSLTASLHRQRTDGADRDSRRTPIASLQISRLGSAAMAPPEGPPPVLARRPVISV